MNGNERTRGAGKVSDADLQWFLQNESFKPLSEPTRRRLCEDATPLRVTAGRRLISQGDQGDQFYIVREGHCLVVMEREGVTKFVGRLGPGDVVGEMAILTGEKRTANVDAETDMLVWAITRDSFDKACEEFPELKQFLTKIVADRLSKAILTRERAIGKYVIDEVIGEGGCSVVYRGYHSGLDMPVAVKMLKHQLAMDPAFVQLFREEAKTIAHLNHDNVVKVYDIEELYRTFFIIMELVEGEPLNRLLARVGRLPAQQALDFILQLCSGLEHAHQKGIIHRDIKPGNILIQGDERVKLVDFGFACQPGTRLDEVAGTVHYMAPEQIRADTVDERTDVYALGITAYEMVTGEKACKSRLSSQIMRWHLTERIPEPRGVVPDLPVELNDFLLRATQREPSGRYENVRQIIHDLEPLAERMGIGTREATAQEFNMMSLFLFYRQEQHDIMHRLVREFRRELEKVGGRLRGADFKNIES
ncbi:MAG: protein kinase [Thermodesulfobacteriota bacterium]